MRFCSLGAFVLTLAACGGSPSGDKPDFFTEAGRAELAQAYLDAEDPDKGTPVVTSRAKMTRYADLFQSACLAGSLSVAQAQAAFRAAGMRPMAVARFSPSVFGWIDESAASFGQMGPALQGLSRAMRRDDGKVPYLTGFTSSSREGNTAKVFTDGIAVGEVNVSRSVNDICSVRIKTRDDEPLLAELERVVRGAGYDVGRPADTGLFGRGYVLSRSPQTMAVIGRTRRSDQSPTSMSLVVFNKR